LKEKVSKRSEGLRIRNEGKEGKRRSSGDKTLVSQSSEMLIKVEWEILRGCTPREEVLRRRRRIENEKHLRRNRQRIPKPPSKFSHESVSLYLFSKQRNNREECGKRGREEERLFSLFDKKMIFATPLFPPPSQSPSFAPLILRHTLTSSSY